MREPLAERRTVSRPSVAAVRAALPASASAYRSPSGERFGRIVALLEGAERQVYAVTDLRWDDVVATEPHGVEEGFEAAVLGGHNFVADAMAVPHCVSGTPTR